ncbi:MAG: hypothetical protein AAB737_03260, partial [Patescibacteria group bacterium]
MELPLDLEGQDQLKEAPAPLLLRQEVVNAKGEEIRNELLHCLSPSSQIDPALHPSQPAHFDPNQVQDWLEADPSPVVRALKEKILQNTQHV